jgi:hypothetical protein|eukprot:TRINITY_DN74164_c0_g1_i1.p1 TRINITY_DN74164_c0_g1~~TRINITY_DN74164_c0_g1_i1.p1  ORF type:complete len:229 (+),score=30.45 TRINITY_DN74164_c0_g1_i1:94-687(+)
MARASSGLALPPSHYDHTRGAAWAGTTATNRFPAAYGPSEAVFDEYLSNKSLKPSPQMKALSQSTGLLELHYDTMRKKQKERSNAPAFVHGPTMDRMYGATSGYGGFIPGKESTNVVGCSWNHGSRISRDVRGSTYKPAMSGVTYSFTNPSRSASSPNLNASSGSGDFGHSRGFGASPSSVGRNVPKITMEKLEPEW